jgi:hypothetical protein
MRLSRRLETRLRTTTEHQAARHEHCAQTCLSRPCSSSLAHMEKLGTPGVDCNSDNAEKPIGGARRETEPEAAGLRDSGGSDSRRTRWLVSSLLSSHHPARLIVSDEAS